MAIRNAIPNPFQFIGQLRPDPNRETWGQYAVAASASLGSIATFVMMVGTLLSIGQFGFANFVQTLRFPESIPLVSNALVFPFFTILTAVLAVPLSFYLIDLSDNRQQLHDDANGMLVFSAITLLIFGTQTAFDFASTLEAVMFMAGAAFLVLYVVRFLRYGKRMVAS